MTDNDEIQLVIGHLGQQNAALSIDLAVARARIARLEQENAELKAAVATSD